MEDGCCNVAECAVEGKGHAVWTGRGRFGVFEDFKDGVECWEGGFLVVGEGFGIVVQVCRACFSVRGSCSFTPNIPPQKILGNFGLLFWASGGWV